MEAPPVSAPRPWTMRKPGDQRRPATDERASIVGKTLVFGETTSAGPRQVDAYGSRIRRSKVCRGKVLAKGPPVEASTPVATLPPSSSRHRVKHATHDDDDEEDVKSGSPPTCQPNDQTRDDGAMMATNEPPPPTKLVHVVIVDNIRARKRSTRLRVTQTNALLSAGDPLSSPDVGCTDDDADGDGALGPETLDDEAPPPLATLEPLVSPNNTMSFSRAQRAMWTSSRQLTDARRQPSKPASIDVSDGTLSSFQGDVEPKHIVGEMHVIKAILLREQLLERLGRVVATADKAALELHAHALPKLLRRKSSGHAESTEDLKVAASPQQASPPPTKSKKASNEQRNDHQRAAVAASHETKLKQAMVELRTLVPDLRRATIGVVATIQSWRAIFDAYELTYTNRAPPPRHFVFQGVNYLEKMSHDVAKYFDGVALAVLLGAPAAPHPLFLPRAAADTLHAMLGLPPVLPAHPTPSTTFVTALPHDIRQQQHGQPYLFAVHANIADKVTDLVANLVASPMPSTEANLHADVGIQRATAAIFLERQRLVDEATAAAVASAQPVYDPFDTIRRHPTVADAFDVALHATEETMAARREALRERQEDTARANQCLHRMVTTRPLQVKTTQVEAMLAQKHAAQYASVVAEARGTGHVLVRQKPTRATDPVHDSVLKIQLQFRQHKFRFTMLVQLKRFSHKIHEAAINIQRIYRGHRAKSTVGVAQNEVLADARYYHVHARRIQRWFGKRRAWHHEAVHRARLAAAAVQVVAAPVGPSASEIYREAGRRRRMERDVQAAKKRAELLQLLARQTRGTIVIQRNFRDHVERKAMRLLHIAQQLAHESRAATHIQALIRCFMAKRAAHRLRAQRKMDTIHESTTLIQAIYRGHRVRQRMSVLVVAANPRATAASTRLPVVLKPAVIKAQPARGARRHRSAVAVPEPLQSPRDKLPVIAVPRRKSGTSWQELKLKEPKIGDQL
ncbi:Aste57867_14593 [Aphanomyces stellatus]|uniref:Aste57867_14593 protein n=1 Tax=Aphanomyces stellatus TaxID=120398 RepID=A0A485L128_9STRA|nr:hypothetical protein As57867_014539 [Aphanomyces stellatus]VFT91412.1 Aste57867_14593 [Aphanomyces stellatus]